MVGWGVRCWSKQLVGPRDGGVYDLNSGLKIKKSETKSTGRPARAERNVSALQLYPNCPRAVWTSSMQAEATPANPFGSVCLLPGYGKQCWPFT